MSRTLSAALRDLIDLGQRDRDAERDLLARRFADSLPSSFPRQGIAAALVANRAGGIDVKPVIVVDFYRSALDANS